MVMTHECHGMSALLYGTVCTGTDMYIICMIRISFDAYLVLEGTYCNFLQDLRNQPQNDLSVLPYTVSQYHASQRSSKVKKVRNPLNQEWTI